LANLSKKEERGPTEVERRERKVRNGVPPVVVEVCEQVKYKVHLE
jgi:hypothetical protein